MNAGLHATSLSHAADAIVAGKLTARALAEAQLARIEATDAMVEAWAHLDAKHVRAAANRCDAMAVAMRHPLAGIGVGIKDIIATGDMPTQMGSPVFAGHRPSTDADCVARLARAGAYAFGKTVTTEFAYFHPGKTRNPWNPRHTPGGSSSGSAAAVAAGHVPGAIGTQTNGSVIRPAAFCGVVGFKPTRGVIPTAGIHVFSETLDQVGAFARNVADVALLTSAIADPGRIGGIIARIPKPPRLAYLGDFPWMQIDCDADDTLEAAATGLRQHADVVPVNFPGDWRDANLVHRTIMFCEGARNLAPIQVRERARLSVTLNAAIDEGRAFPLSNYAEAMRRRDAAIAGFTQWLGGFDAIITPAAPGSAPEGLDSTGDPSCCTLWTLLGFPAITIPVGVDGAGLPIGMQLAAPAGADDSLLGVALWCESRLPFKGLV